MVSFCLLLAACPGPKPPGIDGGADAGDSGEDASVDAGPYDAGIPVFDAAGFCGVWAQTYCRWALGCGQEPASEAQRCLDVQAVTFCDPVNARLDAGRVAFDAGEALKCLLALEDAKCGALPSSCPRAFVAQVPLDGACSADGDCTHGFCQLDGGCGVCTAPLALGSACSGAGQCDDAGYCAGSSCAPKLDAGVSCVGLGSAACRSGRCAFAAGMGDVCASSSIPPSCASSASCPGGWYCNEFGGCAVKLALGSSCKKDDACVSGACVSGKCEAVAVASVAPGGACSAGWQCAGGLICKGAKCVERLRAGAACELAGLDVFVGCPYQLICDAHDLKCAPVEVFCSYPGYCSAGPLAGEPCASSGCRGYSACVTLDGGAQCVRSQALPGEACNTDLASRACAVGDCVGQCPAVTSLCE